MINSKQRQFLENNGFWVSDWSCEKRDFKSGLIEITGNDLSGKFQLEISTWSSSDKSLETMKKLNEDLTEAIEIVELFNEL